MCNVFTLTIESLMKYGENCCWSVATEGLHKPVFENNAITLY